MTSISCILTHPGSAHKDEFLACCVLLARHVVPIVRREPLAEDLANPAMVVLDVGHEHSPERNNFDHHQFPREQTPTCSLSLILQHVDLYEDARSFCEWLEPAEWFDCRGPIETARWLGIPRDVLFKLNSPIDVTLLRRFALVARLEPGEPLWEIMRMIGEDLLAYVQGLRQRLNFIAEQSEVWDLVLAGTPAKVLFLPRTEPLPEEPSSGLDQFIETQGWGEEIIGTVYPDRRGEGYGLSRHRDSLRLDFTKLANHPAVHFAHARGFVAKTSLTEVAELKALLLLAGN